MRQVLHRLHKIECQEGDKVSQLKFQSLLYQLTFGQNLKTFCLLRNSTFAQSYSEEKITKRKFWIPVLTRLNLPGICGRLLQDLHEFTLY